MLCSFLDLRLLLEIGPTYPRLFGFVARYNITGACLSTSFNLKASCSNDQTVIWRHYSFSFNLSLAGRKDVYQDLNR